MNTGNAGTRASALPALVRVLLGLVFLASALLKMLDFAAFAEQVSYYGIVEEGTYLQVVAGATIALELILGVSLLIGWHARIMLALTALVLLAFTALIAYAWAFNDLQECGCFGSYLTMTPAVSIGKNVVLLLMLPFAWPRKSSAAAGPAGPQAAAPAKRRSRTWVFIGGCVLGIVFALVLEIAAAVIYSTVFHDTMMSNLQKKMLAPSPPGTPMPYDWQIRDEAGNPVDMATFKGKPLFITFFSPSCPKCEAQLPSFQRFYEALQDTDVAFVAVSTRDTEKLDTVLERQGCTFPVHTFGETRPDPFERVAVPSGYLFSKDGALLYEQFDAARWDDPDFVTYVKGLAAE